MLDSPSSRGASGPQCRDPGIPQRGKVDLRCLVNPQLRLLPQSLTFEKPWGGSRTEIIANTLIDKVNADERPSIRQVDG